MSKKLYTKKQLVQAWARGIALGEKRNPIILDPLPIDKWIKTKQLKRMTTDGITISLEVDASVLN